MKKSRRSDFSILCDRVAEKYSPPLYDEQRIEKMVERTVEKMLEKMLVKLLPKWIDKINIGSPKKIDFETYREPPPIISNTTDEDEPEETLDDAMEIDI